MIVEKTSVLAAVIFLCAGLALPAVPAPDEPGKPDEPGASGKDTGKQEKDKKKEKKEKKKDAAKKDGKKGAKKAPKERPKRKPSAAPRVIINEILYHPVPDEHSRQFVELFNPGAKTVDLSAWSLADEVTFSFPKGTEIAPGGYLVVGGKPKTIEAAYDLKGVLGPFQGKLSKKGGFLSLLDPKGDLVEEVFYDRKAPFPAEAAGGGASLERIHPDFKAAWHWKAGPVRAEWFRVEKTGLLSGERLVLYLSGEGSCLVDDVQVVPRDAPAPNAVSNPGFESGISGWEASGNHSESAAVPQGRPEEGGKDGKGALRVVAKGPGFGRIHSVSTQLAGIAPTTSVTLSFWVKAERGAPRILARIEGDGLVAEEEMRLLGGTPGAVNHVRATDLEPWVKAVWHEPERPLPGQPVTVLAQVQDDDAVGAVTLEVTDPVGAKSTVPMVDDGVLAKGERAFAAMVPPFPEGSVVRYRVGAVDAGGKAAPLEAEKAFYVGKPAPRGKAVPSFEVLVAPAAMESLRTAKGTWVPGMVIADGVVYDKVRVRHRGHSSMGFPKLHVKLKFDGERFEGEKKVNLSSSWADKSYLREPLAYGVFAEAGVAHCQVKRYARLFLNGSYFGLYYQLEQPGRAYLKRNGLDPDGDLFKCYAAGRPSPTGSYSASDYQNKSSKDPHYERLHEFLLNMDHLGGAELKAWMKDHVDLEEFAGYLAATALVMNSDHVGKNYYLYRDPTTGKWSMIPWDLDLTFGRNFECGNASPLLNDRIRWDNPLLFGTEEQPKCDVPGNRLITKYLSLPEDRLLYYRKLAKMLPGFNSNRLKTLMRANYLAIRPEVDADRKRWGSWGQSATWGLDFQVNEILAFVDKRAKFLVQALNEAARTRS